MSSKLYLSPFVSRLTLAVIHNIQSKRLETYQEKQVIHSDLVPRISEKTMHASFKPQVVSPVQQMMPSIEVRPAEIKALPRRDMNRLIEPIRTHPRNRHPAPRINFQIPQEQKIESVLPQKQTEINISQNYGKIQNFLEEPAISSIECPGPGKPVSIIRAGQRQMTKITLSPDEISELLKKISDSAHIPLMEGVFRAAVDNFNINAVVSEMIGSRFVIKKQTPYAMLE